MSAHAAVRESGPGSFGYPWGTQRPTAFIEQLDRAIHPSEEDEMRRLDEEYERKKRQVRLRRSVLTQIRDSVANCCVPTSSGKLRFKRKLADAAGPLVDFEALRGVVDLDRRRPGRPSANKNSDIQALRSVLRELVYDPAAEERERRGAEVRQASRASEGSVAKPRPALKVVNELKSEAEAETEVGGGPAIVSASDVVGSALDAVALPDPANEDTAAAVVPEPGREPEPLAAPALLSSQGAEMMAAMRDGGPLIASAQVVDFFSKAVEAERAQLLVPKRMPKAIDLTWADHWDLDPNAPLPEMIEVFQAFGAAIDKRPEDLTDDEAFLLGASAVFPTLNWDRTTRKDVPNPKAFRRGEPVPKFQWENEIRISGGTVQMLVAKWGRLVDDLRLEERTRRAMWPLAIARRDLIKRLMTEVSAGTLSFAPRSSRWADLARSVQWRVFRDADHEPLLLLTHYEMELYQQRILDKLPWPEGLSRIELMQAFSEGMPLDKARGIVAYSTRPKWLVPDQLNTSSPVFSVLTIERESYDARCPRPPRGCEIEDVTELTTDQVEILSEIADEDHP